MLTPARIAILAAIGVALIIGSTLFFTVQEDEQAVVLQFGAPVGEPINVPGTNEAGLNMKLPWQNVILFDRKNLEFDLREAEEIIVRNEERLLVDAFVRYEIENPLLYLQTLGATSQDKNQMRNVLNDRLTRILSEAMRDRLGSRTISQIIDDDRAEIMQLISQDVIVEARELGINVIDVRIRQADFPAENAAQVNQRMISDYNQQAELIRARGEERAREIRAEADKEVVRVRAEAEERGQIIRGRADAIRNCIFAGAYQGVEVNVQTIEPPEEVSGLGQEIAGEEAIPTLSSGEAQNSILPEPTAPTLVDVEEQLAEMLGITCEILGSPTDGDASRREFFAFYRSLDAYRTALGTDDGTTIVLSPDSQFFRYFNNQNAN
ncbi:putative hydrolase serine protease transmembrane protein [Parvularcula bermudensis HTCC2503]|uniref:Putative hydrolase serine protease transmembrane protein n=1 Tax=Parvularcula bermudensis (strain ATCC BAA-594 / HTCC2503 / KCTC 12087) TaxID=314260 RepID=E0TCS5_PARBH|nr:protease modulator HflC [Parvularcula bermudensis]ADM09864.1 putative hydrolase serine protease transmembrane protein [Parvularcula bermudensis HTCC2503]